MIASSLSSIGKPAAAVVGTGLTRRSPVNGRLARAAGVFLLFSVGLTAVAKAAELQNVTIQAFSHYVALTEDRIANEIGEPGGFLWIDHVRPQLRKPLLVRLQKGEVIIQNLGTRETRGQAAPILIPQGMVHHWLATVFVPGVRLNETLAQQQDYGRSAQVYGPDIQRCTLLQTDGSDFHVYYRLQHKGIVTVTYNADFDIQFVRIDSTRAYSQSYSTRIAEVVDPGIPSESEKPVGTGRGYLWRLNTYTRYEERDGGVYIQAESLALSRNVPAIFAWLVNPYVKSISRDYLVRILGTTRSDLMSARTRAAEAGVRREGAVQASASSLPDSRFEAESRPARHTRRRTQSSEAPSEAVIVQRDYSRHVRRRAEDPRFETWQELTC